MALINHAKREINAKIVYYGDEGAGKRVSLQYLYDRIKPSLRGELKTVPASGDSLLFFDFSPFDHPVFGGYRIRFHMYSLTGRVSNPAAWKMTLKGADGVVIVADASPDMMPATRESISRLRGFLAAYGVGLLDIPCILQLNRTGSSGQSPGSAVAAELDVPDMRTCLSVTGSGEGVLEALSLLSRDILTRVGQDDSLRSGGRKPVPETVTNAEELVAATPREREISLVIPESAQTAMEESFLSTAEQREDGDGCRDRLKVTLADEEGTCNEGVVRIPLDVTLGGTSRRLVVSISIEQA